MYGLHQNDICEYCPSFACYSVQDTIPMRTLWAFACLSHECIRVVPCLYMDLPEGCREFIPLQSYLTISGMHEHSGYPRGESRSTDLHSRMSLDIRHLRRHHCMVRTLIAAPVMVQGRSLPRLQTLSLPITLRPRPRSALHN